MSALSLRLSDSLHAVVRELARRDAVSMSQFVATAVAGRAAALFSVDYLVERAQAADRSALDRILARVPARPPLAGDELPGDLRQPRRVRGRTRSARVPGAQAGSSRKRRAGAHRRGARES